MSGEYRIQLEQQAKALRAQIDINNQAIANQLALIAEQISVDAAEQLEAAIQVQAMLDSLKNG